MAHDVVFAPEAVDDLKDLYVFIAEQAGDDRALAYVERIEAYCRGFSTFPERGTHRDDSAPGLRLIGFERRITLAFHVDGTTVTLDRILYGGRDLVALFARLDAGVPGDGRGLGEIEADMYGEFGEPI